MFTRRYTQRRTEELSDSALNKSLNNERDLSHKKDIKHHNTHKLRGNGD